MTAERNIELGENVLALIKHNFGDTKKARSEFAILFERKPTSIWPWVAGDRRGIPAQQRERFEELIVTGDIQLLPSTSITDYVRPGPKKEFSEKEPKRNEDLLALIWAVVRHENLGPRALESLMADTNFVERKRTPALLLRWAYHEGGVPKSYQEQFSHALVRSGIAQELLDYNGADPIAMEVFDFKVGTFFSE
ncbi:hypothetical protein [Brucella intermedia]|uniref:hypothetical protein n=1 Tax=Brucella intermedia TaxID=94625 RepID=UPI00235FFE19|nr:hypothetical protein [Brucella intermedia]